MICWRLVIKFFRIISIVIFLIYYFNLLPMLYLSKSCIADSVRRSVESNPLFLYQFAVNVYFHNLIYFPLILQQCDLCVVGNLFILFRSLQLYQMNIYGS